MCGNFEVVPGALQVMGECGMAAPARHGVDSGAKAGIPGGKFDGIDWDGDR